MAEAIRAAYTDVFTVDQQANTKAASELKGIFARLSDKGESVNERMATTFKTLADMADFKTPVASEAGAPGSAAKGPETPPAARLTQLKTETGIAVHHDVHIHLPESTNIAVYDAIFKSLREHLG